MFIFLQVPESAIKHHDSGLQDNPVLKRWWLELVLQLNPSHYYQGQLNLQCVAEIPKIYSQTSEVQLSASARNDPVARRGKQNNIHLKRRDKFQLLLLLNIS